MEFNVAQLGSRMHYGVARVLGECNALGLLYTDICGSIGFPSLLRHIPASWLPDAAKRLRGRIPVGIPKEKMRSFDRFGWEYAKRRSTAKSKGELGRSHLWAGETFCRLILSQSRPCGDGVYVFNTAGLELLKKAREEGVPAILEQTIAPMKVETMIMREERDRFPNWEDEDNDCGARQELAAREEAEWGAASSIICGSEFVKNGIRDAGGPWEKCIVVPYGVDGAERTKSLKQRNVGRRTRVLFVGAVGLRKGIQYLAAAANLLQMSKFEVRAVGSITVSERGAGVLRSSIELVGPIPRSEIMQQFQWADIFVLPTLCEGSATVCYEALRCGLPIITTPNCGSVVRDGVDGFIVPIRDPQAIAQRLEELERRPDLLMAMSEAAQSRGKEFGLVNYGKRLRSALHSRN